MTTPPENGNTPPARRGVLLFALCGAVAVVGELPVYNPEHRLITDEKLLARFRQDFDQGNVPLRKLTIEAPATWSVLRGEKGWVHNFMFLPTPVLTLLRPISVNLIPEESDVATNYRAIRAGIIPPVNPPTSSRIIVP